MPATDTPTRALPTLHEFFSPGGILARSPLPYEYRPGQLEMAKAVERALTEHRHLIVEAGTGTTAASSGTATRASPKPMAERTSVAAKTMRRT